MPRKPWTWVSTKYVLSTAFSLSAESLLRIFTVSHIERRCVLLSESPHCYRFLPWELVRSKSFSRTCLGAWTLALDVPTSPELVNLTPSTSERARSDPTQSTFRDKRTGFAHRETESTTVRQPLGAVRILRVMRALCFRVRLCPALCL